MRYRSPCFGLFLVSLALSAATATAQPRHAPLDTLIEPGVHADGDPRYAGANIDFSRKLLPDVHASEVELSGTPKRPPRLDDPMGGAYRYHLARQAAFAGNTPGITQNMNAALEATPNSARYQWWRSIQAIKAFDTAALSKHLPASLKSVINSPLSRGPFVLAAHQVTLLLTLFFWSVLAFALYLCWWRNIAHDLGAMVLADPRHQPRWLLPLLVPVAVLLFKPGWLGLLAALSVPLLIQTRGRARTLLLFTWFCALALVFPDWPALRMAVPTVDPDSEVTLLDRAAIMPPSAAIAESLEERLATATDPERRNRLLVAVAIQEARRGNYTNSSKLYQKVLEEEPQNYPALVGRANNTYYRGRMDDAAELYRQAAKMHPHRGEVPYNLAQVYFKKLFVPEATEALEVARALGYSPPIVDKSLTKRDGYSAVVYPGLTAIQMAAACRFEAGSYPALVSISSWRHLLGAPPLPHYVLVGSPLLLAMLAVMWWSRQNDPRDCENCGTPLCRACSKVKDNAWLCSSCGETAERSKSDMVLATLLKNKSRSEGLAHATRIIRLGRLLPGAGHLASGHLWHGWFRLGMVSAGLFLVFAGWAFDPGAEWDTPGLILPSETIHAQWLPLPSALWPGWTGISILVGAALLVLAWIIAFLDAPGLRRGLPDRFSLAPTTGPRERNPGVGAGAH